MFIIADTFSWKDVSSKVYRNSHLKNNENVVHKIKSQTDTLS